MFLGGLSWYELKLVSFRDMSRPYNSAIVIYEGVVQSFKKAHPYDVAAVPLLLSTSYENAERCSYVSKGMLLQVRCVTLQRLTAC
eukprot:scaffold29539_cov20-Prasinocladus_malaysianus.AAC.1